MTAWIIVTLLLITIAWRMNAELVDDLKDSSIYFGPFQRLTQLSIPEDKKTTVSYSNILAARKACSMETILVGPERFDFTECDQFLNFANDHKIHLRGPALVSYSSIPDFIQTMTVSERERCLMNYIDQVLSHYRDHENNTQLDDGKRVIFSWDIVDEAVQGREEGQELPSGPRVPWSSDAVKSNLRTDDNPWMEIGNYIERAFVKASKIDPDIELYYTDLCIPKYNQKGELNDIFTDNLFRFFQIFERNRIPLDGFGLDLHLDDRYYPRYKDLSLFFQDLDALHLNAHISFLDWNSDKLIKQARIYQEVTQACMDAPNCKVIMVSGWSDRDVPYRSGANENVKPYLFDEDYNEKPSMEAIASVIENGSNSPRSLYKKAHKKRVVHERQIVRSQSVPIVTRRRRRGTRIHAIVPGYKSRRTRRPRWRKRAQHSSRSIHRRQF